MNNSCPINGNSCCKPFTASTTTASYKAADKSNRFIHNNLLNIMYLQNDTTAQKTPFAPFQATFLSLFAPFQGVLEAVFAPFQGKKHGQTFQDLTFLYGFWTIISHFFTVKPPHSFFSNIATETHAKPMPNKVMPVFVSSTFRHDNTTTAMPVPTATDFKTTETTFLTFESFIYFRFM